MTDYAIQQIVNALSAGSLYALMAVGLAMVFGILRLINFAHGDVMMIAAYIAVVLPGRRDAARGRGAAIMVVGTVVVGLLMERIAYRPIRGAPDVAMLLTSFAVGQILQNGTLLVDPAGRQADPDRVPEPGAAERRRSRSGRSPCRRSTSSASSPGSSCSGSSPLFVTRTTLGLSMRAAAEDLNAAQLMGIKINRVVATAFAIGAGAGRRRRASSTRSRPARSTRTWASRRSSRHSSRPSSAASAASPGRSSAATSSGSSRSWSRRWPGSATCCRQGSVPPEVRAFLQQWLPSSLASYRDAVVFVVLILVLLVRPQGILGKRDQGDL